MRRAHQTGVAWDAIDAVIFDVDGTLFDHLALRRPLLAALIRAVLLGYARWQDLRVIARFRSAREALALAEAHEIGSRQYQAVADALGLPPEMVEVIAVRWMQEAPLPHIRRYAFPGTERFLAALRARGIRTGVFSDYPAEGKLNALGLQFMIVCDAGQPEIGRLKPCPDGFMHVARRLGVTPERCLVIGDREERDGAAARRGGFAFLQKVHGRPPPGMGQFICYDQLTEEVERMAAP